MFLHFDFESVENYHDVDDEEEDENFYDDDGDENFDDDDDGDENFYDDDVLDAAAELFEEEGQIRGAIRLIIVD